MPACHRKGPPPPEIPFSTPAVHGCGGKRVRPAPFPTGLGYLLSALLFLLLSSPLSATTLEQYPAAAKFFPEADRIEGFSGDPPAAAVHRDDQLLGYLLRTAQVAPIPGYSGKPIDILVGIDTEGMITGAEVLEHHEPILLVGIPERRLFEFADQHVGERITQRMRVGGREKEGYVHLDAVTGATVTVIVVNRSILRAARRVAAARGLIETVATEAGPAEVRDTFEESDWQTLTGDGSIRRLLLEHDEVEVAFAGTEAAGKGTTCSPGEACGPFIDLYYTYLNPPTIGRNLLGRSGYNWLMNQLAPGEHAIAVMANGDYSFKGSGYVRGGVFDRLQLVQGNQTILFRDSDYHRLADTYLAGMPALREQAIFIIRQGYAFDPGRPWQLELLARRQVGALDSVFTTFTAEYEAPEKYLVRPTPPETLPTEAEEGAIWRTIWAERAVEIGLLLTALGVLTLVLVFQDWLAHYRRLVAAIRTGFLLFTLVGIGWVMLGQLSVVNVLTFTGALRGDFQWGLFLSDPILFILWTYVAATLLLWGRGVFCGWLCPYGALQKLVNQAARLLRVPQLLLPAPVHERLWAIKYIVFLALFGLSLQSIATAERYAEVEPFKTAITLHFQREWWFVLYAAGLVAVSAVNSKFFCKYLCPLGAALAIPARLRIFEWLKRHKECGHPCQICANECESQAIDPLGAINPNECHYCLDCQVTYWDEHKCPPMVDRRKRREKAERVAPPGSE